MGCAQSQEQWCTSSNINQRPPVNIKLARNKQQSHTINTPGKPNLPTSQMKFGDDADEIYGTQGNIMDVDRAKDPHANPSSIIKRHYLDNSMS